MDTNDMQPLKLTNGWSWQHISLSRLDSGRWHGTGKNIDYIDVCSWHQSSGQRLPTTGRLWSTCAMCRNSGNLSTSYLIKLGKRNTKSLQSRLNPICGLPWARSKKTHSGNAQLITCSPYHLWDDRSKWKPTSQQPDHNRFSKNKLVLDCVGWSTVILLKFNQQSVDMMV